MPGAVQNAPELSPEEGMRGLVPVPPVVSSGGISSPVFGGLGGLAGVGGALVQKADSLGGERRWGVLAQQPCLLHPWAVPVLCPSPISAACWPHSAELLPGRTLALLLKGLRVRRNVIQEIHVMFPNTASGDSFQDLSKDLSVS